MEIIQDLKVYKGLKSPDRERAYINRSLRRGKAREAVQEAQKVLCNLIYEHV